MMSETARLAASAMSVYPSVRITYHRGSGEHEVTYNIGDEPMGGILVTDCPVIAEAVADFCAAAHQLDVTHRDVGEV